MFVSYHITPVGDFDEKESCRKSKNKHSYINEYLRGDERSWIYGIEAKFLIKDCKLEII